MTEEAAPRVEEKPATHKKKIQLWIFVSAGIVLGLLLVLTIINIVSKMNGGVKTKQVQQPEVVTRQTADRQDQFEQLVGNRKPTTRTATEGTTGTTDTSSLEQRFDQLRANTPEGRKAAEEAESEKALSVEEKSLRQWKAREALRALESPKATWGLEKANARSNSPGGAAHAASSGTRATSAPAAAPARDMNAQIAQLNRPFNDGDSLEQRRAEVRKRIEEAQALRATLARDGASGLPAAAARGAAPAVSPARQELQQVSSGFSKAPSNVVGYTKDNKYNADIEGKIKVPPGTEILTTLTKKAVSDYANSSLKAIVNRDVYDISRQYVIFPKGTEINIGIQRTRNVNEAISNRVAFLVKNGVLPNGNVIDFSKAATADREGVGAIQDQTDYHFWPQFFGVAAYALVSSQSSYSGTGDEEGSYAGDVGAGTREQFSPLVQKYLNIVPTQTIRPGQSFQVIIEEEMYVEPWSDLYAKYVD